MKKAKLFTPARATSSRTYNGRAHIDAMYDATWEKYRAKFLDLNSKCYACSEKSEVCDHLLVHKGDYKLFWKVDNYIPLCHRCHNTITSLFDSRHRSGDTNISPKLRWLFNSRLIKGLDFKVKVLPFDKETSTHINKKLGIVSVD